MVTIPEKNFLLLAGEALIGCLAISYGITYGICKLVDKHVFNKQ